MSDYERETLRNKEHESLPSGRLRDAIDQAEMGSPHELARGGCLSKVLVLAVILISLVIMRYCSLPG
ncbi:DUF6366 family protein [Brevibacillus brevis]|uniref:DUF6366 family protein n=1 Tax=Brevibacillus brevis TaxID=1393 RepID=A0ABY9SWD8_BREBE|nr:DUF6366 family protein [Brevibacillus brevis]WNC12135.1 DUF6366 family protein [Brevibacillus brevis]